MTLPADTPRFATRSNALVKNSRSPQKSLFDLIRAVQLRPVLLGKGHVGEDVFFRPVHQSGEFWQLRAHLIRDLTPLRLGRRVVGLGKGCRDEG